MYSKGTNSSTIFIDILIDNDFSNILWGVHISTALENNC